jgi:hypothetical protein
MEFLPNVDSENIIEIILFSVKIPLKENRRRRNSTEHGLTGNLKAILAGMCWFLPVQAAYRILLWHVSRENSLRGSASLVAVLVLDNVFFFAGQRVWLPIDLDMCCSTCAS